MLQLQEPKAKPQEKPQKDGDIQFSWGPRKEVISIVKSIQCYNSCTLDGVEYILYDCVYMWRDGQDVCDIGKIVRMWETESHKKKVKIVWFFRPIDIACWLRNIKPIPNEIFLACGTGPGLSNINLLEAIVGKCNVVCSSKDERNSQPTEEELRRAEFIFYRTFDTEKHEISENFPSTIGGIEMNHFLNRNKDARPGINAETKETSKDESENFDPFPACQPEIPVRAIKDGQYSITNKGFKAPAAPIGRKMHNLMGDGPATGAKVKHSERSLSASPSDIIPLKKRKLLGPIDDAQHNPQSRVSGHEKLMIAKDSSRGKSELYTRVNLEKVSNFAGEGAGNKQNVNPRISYEFMEITRKPDSDSSKWFKQPSWEEKLREAHEKGRLVLLENLDPSFTSTEVEDIVWHVFEQKIKATMVPKTAYSSPRSGQAFAILRTKEAADNLISQLHRGCLMLVDGRPIVGCRKPLREPGFPHGFVGHISIDRIRTQRQRDEMRNAVSTSHFSQSNTIEYDLALQWQILEAKSNLWWAALYESYWIIDLFGDRRRCSISRNACAYQEICSLIEQHPQLH